MFGNNNINHKSKQTDMIMIQKLSNIISSVIILRQNKGTIMIMKYVAKDMVQQLNLQMHATGGYQGRKRMA